MKALKQGEIWLVNFDPTVGYEIKKMRPAVVVSGNFTIGLDLKMICPITNWRDDFKAIWWLNKLSNYRDYGLDVESCVNCYQLRCVSSQRFVKKLGKLDKETMEEVSAIIQNCVEVD